LKELLEIERERLRVAVRIEKDRNIVFPETSVIIHDIWKLLTAIAHEGRKQSDEPFDIDKALDFEIEL